MSAMQPTHPLGVLMRTVREANGWSFGDVSKRAEVHGHKLSKSGVALIEKQPPVSVSVRQVKALADGLQLPERQIVSAFLASMGYAPEAATSTVEDAIRADGRLSTEDRRLLLDMLGSIRRRATVTRLSDRHGNIPDPRREVRKAAYRLNADDEVEREGETGDDDSQVEGGDE